VGEEQDEKEKDAELKEKGRKEEAKKKAKSVADACFLPFL